MKNIKAKHVLVIALALISALILTVQAYAVGMGGDGAAGGNSVGGSMPNEGNAGEMTGDVTGDANSYGDVTNGNGAAGGNGIVGDDSSRNGTLGDESSGGSGSTNLGEEAGSLMNDVGDAVTGEDGGVNWVSVIVAIALGGALVAVVVALIPKKRVG